MEIKAIQCPKCGSTQKTETQPNRFRCDSCGPEYVLDDGKTTIVQQNFAAPVQPSKNKFLFLGLAGAGMALFIIIAVIVSSSSGSSYHPADIPVATGLPDHRWDWSKSFLFTTADKKAVLLSLGTRIADHTGSTAEETGYAVFADAVTGKKLRSVKMPHIDNSQSPVRIQEFSNGDIYITNGNSTVLRVGKADFSVTDVSKSLFDNQPELINGVATIDFVSYENEDGFKLITNDGKTLNYFPLVHKVYTNDQLWAAEQGFKNLLPGSTEKTAFTFCTFFTYGQSSNDQNPPLLIKYRYMDNGAGPKRPVGSLPKGLNDENQKNPRVISYTDFTPGRVYFSEKLLCQDSDYVLIAYKPTAARGSDGPQVQCLDAHTGKIVFTVKMPDDALNIDTGVRSKDGFSILSYSSAYNIGMDGKFNHFTESKDYEY